MAGAKSVSVVLDASATLAIVFEEEGAEIAIAESAGALLSAVNLDEVLHKSARRGIAMADVEKQLGKLGVIIVPFDIVQARLSSGLHSRVDRTGTSFADRTCLALGLSTGRQVLTSDGKWLELDLGIDIRLIR